MTTQLRLVEPPESRPDPRADATRRASKGTATTAPRRGRVTGAARSGRRATRRAASWGDWHLDAGTRRVGRAGVASARRALEAVVEEAALEQGLRAS